MILFNCKKASHICDKAQYAEAKPWEKRMMKLHHLMCKLCREHAIRNTRLTHLVKQANLTFFPTEKKKALKKMVNEQLSKNP
ncbi:MAG: hypothetical protein CMC08_02730 [Flavobacteriaceae bacterium]|nr:hypothetical protein [Flavobacteriaceae bacterium]